MSRMRLGVEVLEQRDVPSTLVYDGPNNGPWSDPNDFFDVNSGEHRTPEDGDSLDFGELGGSNTSSVDDLPDLTVNAIEEGNTFTGAITVVGNLTVSTSFSVYGTVTVNDGAKIDAGSMVLNNTALLNVNPNTSDSTADSLRLGLLDMVDGSRMHITGSNWTTKMSITTLTMAGGATWDIDASSNVVLDGHVGSSGTINFGSSGTGAILTVTDGLSSGGTLNLLAGSILSVAGAEPMDISGQTNASDGVVISDTAGVKMEGAAVLELQGPSMPGGTTVTINGNLDEEAGTIQFDDLGMTLSVTGNFSVFIGTISLMVVFDPWDVVVFGPSDSITVSGSTDLDEEGSKLIVNSIDAVIPGVAQGIISTGGEGTGAFSSVTGPDGLISHGWQPPQPGATYVLQY